MLVVAQQLLVLFALDDDDVDVFNILELRSYCWSRQQSTSSSSDVVVVAIVSARDRTRKEDMDDLLFISTQWWWWWGSDVLLQQLVVTVVAAGTMMAVLLHAVFIVSFVASDTWNFPTFLFCLSFLWHKLQCFVVSFRYTKSKNQLEALRGTCFCSHKSGMQDFRKVVVQCD